MDLNGKTFIVTGGGSGLGGATASLFVESGANVIVADINAEAGEKVVSELGDAARFSSCDVTDEAQVQAAIDLAKEAFGGLHGAVNCAGVGAASRVTKDGNAFPLDMFKFVIDINLIGTFNVIRLGATPLTDNDPDAQGDLA